MFCWVVLWDWEELSSTHLKSKVLIQYLYSAGSRKDLTILSVLFSGPDIGTISKRSWEGIMIKLSIFQPKFLLFLFLTKAYNVKQYLLWQKHILNLKLTGEGVILFVYNKVRLEANRAFMWYIINNINNSYATRGFSCILLQL